MAKIPATSATPPIAGARSGDKDANAPAIMITKGTKTSHVIRTLLFDTRSFVAFGRPQ